ncbi:MAG: Hpt domain-containing protein, partial [Planctomycetales bacterium]|nr:Hpt domain-containing protein [Planctomycetales bacterium]
MMDLNDPTIIQEFIEESNEHLADVEAQLLEIEQAGADIDVELVNTVFRAVHSVKGTAGFLGLEIIQQLAHVLENVLNLVRNRELVPDNANVEVMLKAADDLRNLINDIDNSNNADITERVTALLEIANQVAAQEIAHDNAPPAETAADNVPAESTVEAPEDCSATESPAAADPAQVVAGNPVTPDLPAAAPVESAPPAPVAATPPAPAEKKTTGEGGSGSSAHGETSIRVPVSTL